jgi:hypothetical protein
VKGRPADKRADIWAFGVVLYEMLTGRQLLAGETISDTLAAVLKEEPDLTRAPARVRRLLHACLQKDPKQRLGTPCTTRLWEGTALIASAATAAARSVRTSAVNGRTAAGTPRSVKGSGRVTLPNVPRRPNPHRCPRR